MQRLLALAGQVYASAVTEETRLSYAHRWGRFTAWCAERGLESLPARPEVLMVYLSDAAASGSSVTTLRGWSAAINRIHVEAGKPLRDPIEAWRSSGGGCVARSRHREKQNR